MISLDDKISHIDSLTDEELLSLVAQKDWDCEKAKAAFDVFYKRYSFLKIPLNIPKPNKKRGCLRS